MSGVFGFFAPGQEARALANRMALAMSHRDWYVAEAWTDVQCPLALGRIGIGIFNCAPQPLWNNAGTIALVMAGEIYEHDLSIPPAASQEEIALAAYQEQGDDFARHLNGAFVIAVWDVRRQSLLIANDRFGLYPHYFAAYDGSFIFAPEIKGVLENPTVSRALDETALAQYMRFQHLLGDRTFFEHVKLLPPASVLYYELGSAAPALAAYWSLANVPFRPQVKFPEAVEEAGSLLRRAVHRFSSDSIRPGLHLSGGLDSRTILGLTDRRPITTIGYGDPASRDAQYATQIARAARSEHHHFDLGDGSWVKDWAPFHLDLTEGLHSWIHAHGISTLPFARQQFDVLLTGWDGATVMGHNDSIEPLQMHAVDDDALTVRLFHLFNQRYTWPSLTEPEEALMYCEPYATRLRGAAFESFRQELGRFLPYRPDVRGEYFYIRNHCTRLTLNLITFSRSHVEVRFPFFDYALFEFLYSLPATVRGHRTLYRAVIQRETPRLALIPYAQNDYLPTTRRAVYLTHASVTKIRQRLVQHLPQWFAGRPTLYADYENYVRGALRTWTSDLLYDSRTVSRGIFRPGFVRSLLDRHLSNREVWTIGKLAPIMTYEMMLRALVDAAV